MIKYKNISLADRVFDDLEKKILNGTYPRGMLLSESKLCEELDVSRTPVREAIRRLIDEDLVEEQSNGLLVLGMTDEDMKDIYEIKKRVESVAVGRAALVVTDEQLKTLRDILDQADYYAMKGDHEKVRDFDTQFHDTIYDCCGSRVYRNVLKTIHHKVMRYRKASLSSHESRITESVAEHRAIYNALAAHDQKQAEQAMKTHAEHALASVLEAQENGAAQDNAGASPSSGN